MSNGNADGWEAWNRAQLTCDCADDECCDVCRHEPDKQSMIADWKRDMRLIDD